MSPQERKAALDLFPYFSKEPIIFDVGSNKGEWADMFIDRAAEIHLFEPNELLLHYTMVKYCDRKNVNYHGVALDDVDEMHDVKFYHFTNENNGLSSILNNPKWDYLPKKVKPVSACSLDFICGDRFRNIDLVKLDTEGAEMLILKGAYHLLARKIIRFIQVEKAEHINISGYTFKDLIKYLKSFGYAPIETEDTENVIFAMEGFTQDWNREFKENTKGLERITFALEIGCFEGLTTNYICDNLLKPEGRIVCIDPLTDEYLPGHEDNALFVGQYNRFIRNTKDKPVELIRKKSEDAYEDIKDYLFDFIYIDGDHREKAVYNDGCFCFEHLRSGGHLLFDDYQWRNETKRGIDRFLKDHEGRFELVVKGYQVMIKKN